MADSTKTKRVFLIGNPDKHQVADVLDQLKQFAGSRCRIVGATLGLDGGQAVSERADRLIVIGGDGTLIGVARSLGDDQIPLVGVHVGKLGFLTEFSLDELKANFDQAISDETIISRRAVLRVNLKQDGHAPVTHLAINDCVIRAGAPFRMINLGVSINDDHLTEISGDGLIICTPSGSTAHNLSAGGPIMQPGVDAIVLTPLCAHSLTHKPLVVERDARIDIHACAVNEGTRVIVDGQISLPLKQDDRLSVQRAQADCRLVKNPSYASWHKLVTKLRWGTGLNYE